MNAPIFSISKASKLTGISAAAIQDIFASLPDDPTAEEIVAAFVAAARAEKAPQLPPVVPPKTSGLFSQLELAKMTGTYPEAVKKVLKGITPVVNKRNLKQYRLTQKNSAGKTVKELIESIQEDSHLSDVKTRSAIADAEFKEMKVQKARRELVPYGEVVDSLQRVIHLLFQRTAVNRQICKPCRGVIAKVFNDVRNNSKSILRSN